MGTTLITEDVGTYVANAVRREFRQAGISLKGDTVCTLEGEINEFLFDSLGFSVDFITDFRYILYDSAGKVLLDNSYQVNFSATKQVQAPIFLANLNKSVSDNIKQLM